MVTNLANLMSIVSEEEKKFSNYGFSLKTYAYNISIQELDGKTNVTEDYKKDFEKYYDELTCINNKRKLNDSDELKILYRDKLFQIKQLLRNDLVIVYDYEED